MASDRIKKLLEQYFEAETTTADERELREYFKIWDDSLEITDCVCTYDGKFYAKINGKRKELQLKEAKMPFKSKQKHSAKKE